MSAKNTEVRIEDIVRQYAVVGARERLAQIDRELSEIDRERARLLKMFPGLVEVDRAAHAAAETRLTAHWTQRPENRAKLRRVVAKMTSARHRARRSA